MKNTLLLLAFLMACFSVNGQVQTAMDIQLHIELQHRPLILEDSLYTNDGGITIKMETCRFYLSAICLYQDQQRVYTETNSYHLIDLAEPGSLTIRLQIPKGLSFNALSFLLGIDSLTNVSGARGGDLDPTKGMYWTWQSGYVNAKIEGRTYAPDKKFEWHLGGYQSPYATAQLLRFNTPRSNTMHLKLDLSKFLSHVNLSTHTSVMSPGAQAQRLSKLLATCFDLQ